MNEQKIKRSGTSIFNEKVQYIMAFGIIASMLMVATIPAFVIFFFAVFAFFMFKMISSGSRSGVRDIFEFYLSANEILKNGDSKWFAFEINEVIEKGENILLHIPNAPPLVHFTLGTLYNKIGDHKKAVKHLANVFENPAADEAAYAFPAPELRSYVKILRKIERRPGEAPLTHAAIRSLERTRRIRGEVLLEESRTKFADNEHFTASTKKRANILEPHFPAETDEYSLPGKTSRDAAGFLGDQNGAVENYDAETVFDDDFGRPSRQGKKQNNERDRKSISEVLHDIYDKNVQ